MGTVSTSHSKIAEMGLTKVALKCETVQVMCTPGVVLQWVLVPWMGAVLHHRYMVGLIQSWPKISLWFLTCRLHCSGSSVPSVCSLLTERRLHAPSSLGFSNPYSSPKYFDSATTSKVLCSWYWCTDGALRDFFFCFLPYLLATSCSVQVKRMGKEGGRDFHCCNKCWIGEFLPLYCVLLCLLSLDMRLFLNFSVA